MSRTDDQRDALALIRASMEDDQEAVNVLLDHSDLRGVAAELAVLVGLLTTEQLGGHERALAYIAQLQPDWTADEAGA